MAQFPLKRNSEGKAVAYLQLAINPILKKRRLLPLAVNGRFDYDTEAAIDRVFGTKQVSQELYIKYFQSLSSGLGWVAPTSDKVSFPLINGRKGGEVVAIQVWINQQYRLSGSNTKVSVDGSFGKQTATGLFKFVYNPSEGLQPPTKRYTSVEDAKTKGVSKELYKFILNDIKKSINEDWNGSKYTPVPKGGTYEGTTESGGNTYIPGSGGGAADNKPEYDKETSKMAVPLLIAGAAGLVLPSFFTDEYGQPDRRVKMIGTLLGLGAGGYGAYLMINGLMGGGTDNVILSYPASDYRTKADEIHTLLNEWSTSDEDQTKIVDSITGFVRSKGDWVMLLKSYGVKRIWIKPIPGDLKSNLKMTLDETNAVAINTYLSQFGSKL